MKILEDVYGLPGMLTYDEVDFLYRLGQVDHCEGVIVEIGSWKGKIHYRLGARRRGGP